MKKLLLLILILLLSPILLLAQEDENGMTYEESLEQKNITVMPEEESQDTDSSLSITNNDYFQLEIIRKAQSPFNKKIPFEIVITPKIDSPKTQIIWSTPSVFTVEKEHSEFVSLQKDNTYTYTAKLKPNKEGTYNISVNVVSWQFNSNKSASVEYNITINKSLTVQPIDSMYVVTLLLFVLGILGVSALAVYLIMKAIKVLIKKAKIWLTPPI